MFTPKNTYSVCCFAIYYLKIYLIKNQVFIKLIFTQTHTYKNKFYNHECYG